MSAKGKTTTTQVATGDAYVDGVISGYKWGGTSITYSFPTTNLGYDRGYFYNAPFENFGAVSEQIKATARFALDADAGVAAAAGFSVEGFTNLAVSETTDTKANLRFGMSDDPDTAYAFYPAGNYDESGDVWFGRDYDFSNPVAGTYEWFAVLHEIGHALGLKHGHETDVYGAVPADADAMEYTIMTYRSYVGGTTAYVTNETYGYAQTFMMYDIAALQAMYGADFTTNSGDTVYSWSPDSGDTLVNGAVAIDAGANRIFATIWDGGGTDTYDLSAYTSDLLIDLRPGASSLFSATQQAHLGDNQYASGNIYNALLYQGDTRSLIENAIGGSGDDTINGNQADNELIGNDGDDTIDGAEGDDTAVFRGTYATYSFSLAADGGLIVEGSDGTDTLYNIETLEFDDQSVAVADLTGGGGGGDVAYYYYATNSASGDTYYGTVFDDGSYGYYVGYSVAFHAADDDQVGQWTYQIYDSYAYGYDTGVTPGTNYVHTYLDGETGISDTPEAYTSGAAAGYAGLGSELDYVDFGTGKYDVFGRGYYEADYLMNDTVYYYYAYNTGSGDTYYGYVFDDGSYNYYEGYSTYFYASDEDGSGYWNYYVYDSYAYGYDTGVAAGSNAVYNYYDGETGQSDTPYYYEIGSFSGTGGLGSELDYVDFGTGSYDLFGQGFYEAEAPAAQTDTAFYYYAYNTASGDTYYGYVIDDGSYGYYEGYSTYFYASDDDNSGYWNYYIYDSYDYGYDTGVTAGSNAVYNYYDGETGQSDTPYYYENGAFAGTGGLGSEYDYVDFGTGSYDTFGYGYYEADAPSTDTAFYYYAYNTASGDTYYGYVIDDGSYGYYEGYSTYFYASDDDNSGYWNYYVYDSYDYGYDTGVAAGSNAVYSYYDGETGFSDTPYYFENNSFSGTGGLGSEYDYVDFGTGNFDTFGYGYYEADYF